MTTGGKEKGSSEAKKQGKATGGDDCRCKETAEMSPRELLERMMKDLAFWKKEKK